MDTEETKDEFMRAAIEEARFGLKEGGIPVGAILIRDNKIVGRGHNQRIQKNDPCAHAEIECIRNAERIGSYKGTTLYSTLMPCYLCGGAIVQFGIEKVNVGESRSFKGAPEFMKDHWVNIDDWDLKECFDLIQEFIQKNPQVWNEDIGNI